MPKPVTTTKSKTPKEPKRVVVRPTIKRNVLDKPAYDFARLLADPCGAPVVHGLSFGSGGSIVVRLESDSIFFSGATETAGIYYWIPGALRAFQNAAPNDTTGITLQQVAVPGAAFLNNYSSARAVAACIQIMFPGTELQRSGVVGLGVVGGTQLTNMIPAGFGGAAGTATVGQVRASCQIVERTPENVSEVRLRPGEVESKMCDLAALSADQTETPLMAQGKNALLVCVSGLPAGVGIRIRSVCVYELNPLSNQGIVASVETKRSNFSEAQVVQALDEKKPNWWHTTAADIGYAALAVGAVGAVSYYGGPEAGQKAASIALTGNTLRNMGR